MRYKSGQMHEKYCRTPKCAPVNWTKIVFKVLVIFSGMITAVIQLSMVSPSVTICDFLSLSTGNHWGGNCNVN